MHAPFPVFHAAKLLVDRAIYGVYCPAPQAWLQQTLAERGGFDPEVHTTKTVLIAALLDSAASQAAGAQLVSGWWPTDCKHRVSGRSRGAAGAGAGPVTRAGAAAAAGLLQSLAVSIGSCSRSDMHTCRAGAGGRSLTIF